MQAQRRVQTGIPWPAGTRAKACAQPLKAKVAAAASLQPCPLEAPPLQRIWQRFQERRLAMAATLALLFVVTLALAAPVLAPYDPSYIDLRATEKAPSLAHPLGTDRLGRDVLSRLLYGTRVSLGVALSAAALAGTLGTTLGALAGYVGGRVDTLLMRATDLVLALPTFFLLVAAQAVLGASLVGVVIIIALTGWMGAARLVRGQFLSLVRRDFVEAARALGCTPGRIIFRHVLPNASSQVIVLFTLGVADAVLIESALSFLGLGVPPYQASWGNMLIDGQVSILSGSWWIAFFPGLMILLTALSVNLLGDGLQEALGQ